MNVRYLTNNLITAFLVLVEVFLGLRLLLKLFGANASNGFVNWVYEMSGALLEPFRNIFPIKVFENTYVFEFSTLFAMVMYGVVALLLVGLLDAVAGPTVRKIKK
ncbi:hypothetical protein RAAC3_TM7C00001G0271 [Candidatus Saccharibacteria bacterium RAAC3_TM7_1]|nr:hypothetical protein RAAC3_TM7C00001G0271 [Candidatus Saccharibacteria bacterium RAAC3_TM7_1]HCZ28244.1 hypothetical protein [Candidatus Saccharibacteria bacterium]